MSRTLKGLSLFLLMAFAAPLTGVANDVKGNNLQAGETYDLIIDAMPRSVNLIDTGSFANAAESVKDMDQLEAIVSFRVINVIQEPKPKRKALASLRGTKLNQSRSEFIWNRREINREPI